MKTYKTLLLIGAASLPFAAGASEPATELVPVEIEASRIPTDPAKTGASLTILTSEDLAKFGTRPLGEILRQVPGVHFARSGPRGSANTISIRGATATYMLVRIDGINVSDPSTSQVQPLVQHILTSDIERIKILRGSQSSLYGGQAVAGVIEITTKDGVTEGDAATVTLEGGSYDTFRGVISGSQSGEKGSVRASVEVLNSNCFSAADENDGATEADGYENTTAMVRGSYDLTDAITLKGLIRYVDFMNEFDGFAFGSGPADAVGEETSGDQLQVAVGLSGVAFDGRQVHDLNVTYFENERDTVGSFPSMFSGDRIEIDYLTSHELSETVTLLFGANGFEETADPGSGTEESSTIVGGFLQAEVQPSEALLFSVTGRLDDHSDFGSEATWRTTASFQAAEQTRLRGSAGSGFRAPSLFELFDASFGNPDLEPETSLGWDVGVDQSFAEERWNVGVTFFDLTIDDRIEFVFPAGYSTVDGESQSQGIEASISGQLTEVLSLLASYTYLSEAESASGDPLLRVPENDLALSLIYLKDALTVSATANYISGVFDIDNTGASSSIELPSYWVVDAFASYQVSERLKVHARIENLFDEQYQEISGYGTADLSFYAGVEVDL